MLLLPEDKDRTASVIVPERVDERDRETVRHGTFVLVYARAEERAAAWPGAGVAAHAVAAGGEVALMASGTTPTGRGPMSMMATRNLPQGEVEPALNHKSHDFR